MYIKVGLQKLRVFLVLIEVYKCVKCSVWDERERERKGGEGGGVKSVCR